jgi:hypothetical protein
VQAEEGQNVVEVEAEEELNVLDAQGEEEGLRALDVGRLVGLVRH